MHPLILTIETSTSVCSAALCRADEVLAYRYSDAATNHAQLLPRFIDELIQMARQENWAIQAVAVSAGPGSYTGLRIGVSTAKGLAYGWGVPLIAVPTLEVLAAKCLQQAAIPNGAILCPMMDARRMEVYTALYKVQDAECKMQSGVEARVVDNLDWLPEGEIYYFGNGAEKVKNAECKVQNEKCKVHYIEQIAADARAMGQLAADRLTAGQTEDVAYFEPFYLKEFVAAPSHIKGLR